MKFIGPLSVQKSNLDIVSDDGDIFKVQSGIDFIHNIQRCGPVVMQSKHKSQRTEGLLSTRQVWYVLPWLLRRPHTGITSCLIRFVLYIYLQVVICYIKSWQLAQTCGLVQSENGQGWAMTCFDSRFFVKRDNQTSHAHMNKATLETGTLTPIPTSLFTNKKDPKNPVKNWHTDILVIEDNYHTTLTYLNTMPSLNGSRVSTNSSSASPPSVIIWYISFNLLVMCEKPCVIRTKGYVNGYPTMHYFGIPRHTKSMIAYNLTEYLLLA